MRTHLPTRYRIACACGAAVVAMLCNLGCGAAGRSTTTVQSPALPPSGTITVAISPSLPQTIPGGTIPFSASVTGATNKAVTWSVQGTNSGTISSAGVYTAPPNLVTNPSNFVVFAKSEADPSIFASTSVSVRFPQTPSGDVSPTTASVLVNGTIAFEVVGWDIGATGWLWHWSLREAPGGAIVVNPDNPRRATYTAPATAGTFHIALSGESVETDAYGNPWLEVSTTATVTVLAAAQPGTFINTGSMNNARFRSTAVLLHDGRVLLAGGDSNANGVSTAEIYSPATGKFSATGNLSATRYNHAAVALSDGRVLLAGGACTPAIGQCTPSGISSAELYDPASGTFTATANMLAVHACANALPLPNGKALVLGGGPGPVTAEIFDPDTRTFTAANGPNSRELLQCPTAILLANGKVLIAPDPPYYGPPESPIVEIFDPATGQYTTTGLLFGPGNLDIAGGAIVTLLNSGLVLFAGLEDTVCSSGGCDVTAFNAATWLFDPASNSAQTSGSMPAAKVMFTHTLLQDGTVLLTGGLGNNTMSTAELYDPKSGTFSSIGKMSTGRYLHTATLLNDGRVLIVGGVVTGNASGTSAELYYPARSASQPGTMASH
jgi:hypothetical protein